MTALRVILTLLLMNLLTGCFVSYTKSICDDPIHSPETLDSLLKNYKEYENYSFKQDTENPDRYQFIYEPTNEFMHKYIQLCNHNNNIIVQVEIDHFKSDVFENLTEKLWYDSKIYGTQHSFEGYNQPSKFYLIGVVNQNAEEPTFSTLRLNSNYINNFLFNFNLNANQWTTIWYFDKPIKTFGYKVITYPSQNNVPTGALIDNSNLSTDELLTLVGSYEEE